MDYANSLVIAFKYQQWGNPICAIFIPLTLCHHFRSTLLLQFQPPSYPGLCCNSNPTIYPPHWGTRVSKRHSMYSAYVYRRVRPLQWTVVVQSLVSSLCSGDQTDSTSSSYRNVWSRYVGPMVLPYAREQICRPPLQPISSSSSLGPTILRANGGARWVV